ncbi:MAG: chemotaxis protein CheX, partial [Planctomycetes bacterium]|nr:chemotaxis protein CheX [Planctomycetota bacterium]
DIEEDEREEYVEETAGDVINIIVGNATAALQSDGVVIQLSPPVILTEAKKIGRQKDACFYMADMKTPYGEMTVFCAGPKKLLDEQLNYV